VNDSLLTKIDQGDLTAVNNLRSLQSNVQPADLASPGQEPVQPILESIQEELHIGCNEEYCKVEQRDWIISF
jgi:hypothetical protein